jgi:hypothetical protein
VQFFFEGKHHNAFHNYSSFTQRFQRSSSKYYDEELENEIIEISQKIEMIDENNDKDEFTKMKLVKSELLRKWQRR